MRSEYDYIIVGAGTAGSVIASRLSEDKDVNVLLLEAGANDTSFLFHWPAGFARMTKGTASWGWSTVPQKHLRDRVLWYTQAKVRGGGSSINAMVHTRGNAKDYDGWRDNAGCAGWGYADVLPYFKRCEANERFNDDYHGVAGPIGISSPRSTLPVTGAFLRAAQGYGIPYNHDFCGKSQDGVGYYQLFIGDGQRRSSTAVAYLDPARHRGNLDVALDIEIEKIAVEKGRAVGVHVGEKTINASREVVITSGAIGSPRLLMLSGIGPAEHLTEVGIDVVHDCQGVGSNLQDHIDVCVLSECSGDHSYDSVNKSHRLLAAGLQYFLFNTGPAASPLFETGGFWYADKDARSPDIQFHLGQGSGIEAGIVKLDNPGVTLNSANMRPHSRGTVRLASRDRSAAPLIDPNFWAEPKDREISLRGLEMARELMAREELKPFVKREVLPGPEVDTEEKLFDYACRLAKTDHHPVGTCAMGGSENSVVDTELRLRGVDGLRVCDSSVMPYLVSSNTNAATLMIAEKAADLIAGNKPLEPASLPAEHPCSTGRGEASS